MVRIELIDSGLEVGIKIGNDLKFYDKVDVEVSSDEFSVIKLFDKKNQVDIITANTTNFISPKEASVLDLVLLIKTLIS